MGRYRDTRSYQARPEERPASDFPPGYRFLNPYNFVRYLPERLTRPDDPPEVRLMGRCPPPPHDRWVGLSGRIECRAEAVTPIFVSDGEDTVSVLNANKKEHCAYRFFNIGGEKLIPASSLRGTVRSVFEVVTNSCFANFTDARLSYRLDTRDARRLVPARIEQGPDGQWVLRLLTGTAQLDADHPPKELYAAPVRQYKARKPTGRAPAGTPPPPVDLSALGPRDDWHGKECHAVLLKMKFPPAWRVVQVAADDTTAERLRREAEQSGKFKGQLQVRRGWLCITNQNADNKNSERFFFFQGGPGAPETVPLTERVRENYQGLIADYQGRHERTFKDWCKQGKDPSKPYGEDMAFSRPILDQAERKVRGGELVYAMLQGRTPTLQVLFIAPVSVPRVAYNHTTGDLLPAHLHHCESEHALCPACRTFGWVRGEREAEGAYASRVRFSSARLIEPRPHEPMRLAILGTPKPTTTRFYLAGPDERPSDKPREDQEAGYDGNNGRNRLRGRKFYRHHKPDAKFSLVEADQCSDQNRTVQDPEGPGAVFTFTVEFENLAPVELGALLWSLDLGGQGYHRLGYGKPLGLGSLAVGVTGLRLRDPAARYAALTASGWSQPLSGRERHQLVLDFQRATVSSYCLPEAVQAAAAHGQAGWWTFFRDLPNIQDLLALVGKADPALPVHYPLSWEKNSQGQFEWFVGNKRAKGPKLELGLATEDKGLPLIDKYGEER